MPEIELNRIKNPNWSEANQLAIYKHGRGLELGLLWTNPATVVVRAALELGASELHVQCSNHTASKMESMESTAKIKKNAIYLR